MVLNGSQLNQNRQHKFYVGAAAGILARSITAPLDQIKTQQQVKGISFKDAVDVSRGKFFRGNVVNCIRAAPQSAIQFGIYPILKDDYNMTKFTAAVAAGACAYTTTYPLELVKLQLQVSNCSRDALQNIQCFPKPLFKGFCLSLVSYSLFFGTQLTIFNISKEKYGKEIPVILLSAAASALSAVMWFPCDTLRKNYVLHRPFITRLAYKGCMVGCIKTVPFMTSRLFFYEQFLCVSQKCFAS